MEDNAGFQNRALRAARQVHPVRRKQTVSAVRSLLRVASNVDELRDLLENGSPYSEQKILVCWLVGRLGLSELSQCMAFLVTTDDEPIGVRLAAIEALGFLELDEALHTLLAATIDPAVEVRRGAARSLQWWGLADTAKRRLLEIASDRNEVPGVRAQAAESLASFRGAEVGSALRVLLLDESPE